MDFFFFQAEDGIRDKLVTGVQTCALPISEGRPAALGGARAVPAGLLAAVHRHGEGQREDQRPRAGARALRRVRGPARVDPQARDQRLDLSDAPHRRRRHGRPVPAAVRRAALRAHLRGAWHGPAAVLEAAPFLGKRGRQAWPGGSRRAGASGRRNRLCAAAAAGAHRDRRCAVARAGDRRAPEDLPAGALLPHHRHAAARRHAARWRARHGRGAPASAASRATGRGQPGDPRGPQRVAVDGRQRPDHPGGAAHAGGGRERRQHGRDAGADRRLPRRGARALGRLVHAAVRAGPDGAHRPGHRRHRGADVHADLRAGGQPAMSAVTGPMSEPIAAADIARARAAARAARRRTVDVLEESLALQADGFTARLAATLQLECLTMAELRRAVPAFDLLPFAECSQHSCALLRAADGRLLLAFDDPFSGELQAWAEERIAAAFSWCLVHRGDLVAFLAGHEESLRALDAVQEEVAPGPADSGRIEDLSLKSIGDESSEVVRLVRSTLRDALMIGASDVHLETQQQLSLDSLGFDAEDVRRLRRLSNEPYGMLLVTGPTGSGKTTTLYAAISEINNGQDKIVTIEDPVEYQLPGVLQIPVNEKKGLGFARGLRSILRHDPDKIMVGEIRDPETANIAVQSALTGHLVFTTVHANNVFDVIGRFVHMNVDLYGFVSALNAILAQRLVRVVCPHCAEPDQPAAEHLAESGLDKTSTKGWTFRVGRGCRECRGAGYKGRKAIAELMILTDELRELITSRAPVRQLKEAAHRSGTRFLRDAAFEAVRKGETTLQEINRVTFVS